MIGWLNPAALSGLSLLLAPVIVHLLRTHRAERVLFPTLRFIAASRTASVRVHLPSDVWLLVLRAAIVGVAVLAASQPVFVTLAAVRAWNARLARVVVVDTSEGMRLMDASGRPPSAAADEAAEAELRATDMSLRLDGPVLRDNISRASAWLETAPPARREIVVIGSFPHGSMHDGDLAGVAADIGVRFVRVGEAVPERTFRGSATLGAPGIIPRRQEIRLAGADTGVRFTVDRPADGDGTPPRGQGHPPVPADGVAQPGLRVIGTNRSTPDVVRLWRTVAAAGAPAPSTDEPLVCQFGADAVDGIAPAAIGPDAPRWMLHTVLRLQRDPSLRRMPPAPASPALRTSDAWTVIAFDGRGPVVQVAAVGRELLMQVAAAPDSLFAATASRALLVARHGSAAHPEQEVLRLEPSDLGKWSRTSGPVGPDAWRRADRSDARWLWLAALLLLAVEQRVRQGKPVAAAGIRDAA